MPTVKGWAEFEVNVRSIKDLKPARDKIIKVLKDAGITHKFHVTIDDRSSRDTDS
jgi:hypothetical protein